MELMNKTIPQILEEISNEYPFQEALVFNKTDVRYTYEELNKECNKIAKSFLKLGIKRGDHVAVWTTNLPQWIITQLATAKIGAVFIPINTNYKYKDLEYVLKHSDTRILITCNGFKKNNFINTLNELCPSLKNNDNIKLTLEKFPMLQNIIYVGENCPDGMLSWQEFSEIGRDIENCELKIRTESLSPYDVINMQYTSGTTGFPKGVMLTHHNILNNGFFVGEGLRYSPKDRLCLSVPLFHCFGCVMGVMGCLTHASTMVLIEYYNTKEVLETIEREKCTSIYGVPTMYIFMMEYDNFSRFNLGSLRTGIIAGSSCPIQVVTDIINKMNIHELTVCYGQTESSPVVTQTKINDSIENISKTVGVELPFVEIKIIDPLTNKEVPIGTEGELCVRGYVVMKGYYKRKEDTDKAIDKDGWLHSGDLAKKNSDGYYEISGRIKEIIIRGGENISPKEVEDVLHTHSCIQNVQIVGVPDSHLGEEMMCFIILKKDCTLNVDEVKNFVGDNLAKYKVPKYIEFVDEFPVTASGKIQKYKLVEQAKQILSDK